MAARAAAVGGKKKKTPFWFNCLVAISGPVDCRKAATITSTPPLNDSRLQRTLTVTRHYQRWGDTFHCGGEKLLPPSSILTLTFTSSLPPNRFSSRLLKVNLTTLKESSLAVFTENKAVVWFIKDTNAAKTQKQPCTKDPRFLKVQVLYKCVAVAILAAPDFHPTPR